MIVWLDLVHDKSDKKKEILTLQKDISDLKSLRTETEHENALPTFNQNVDVLQVVWSKLKTDAASIVTHLESAKDDAVSWHSPRMDNSLAECDAWIGFTHVHESVAQRRGGSLQGDSHISQNLCEGDRHLNKRHGRLYDSWWSALVKRQCTTYGSAWIFCGQNKTSEK